ncbi:MAG: ArsR/SmtB family transcription factor [Microbacterium sp.]
MADVFALIAEPSRRRILDELFAEDGLRVGELVDATGLTQSNVSKHLRFLRECGLVRSSVEGSARRYRVEPRALAPIEEWLAPYRRKWLGALQALSSHLDEDPAEGDGHGH